MTLPKPVYTAHTVQQAIARSNTLNGLLARMDQSQRCLAQVSKHLPLGLQSTIQAGPLTEGVWCLLVNQASAMSKLKQLKPSLLDHLKDAGLAITEIRFKRVY